MISPTSERSRVSWSELSQEYRSAFFYHAAMIGLFMFGGSLSTTVELGIAGALACILVARSIRHRRRVGWRWPGVRLAQVLTALLPLVAGAIFLGAAMSTFPPTAPHALPWYLAGAGIVVLNVLQALRIITVTEAEFINPSASAAAAPTHESSEHPWWHRWVRRAWVALFAATWLSMAAHMHLTGQAIQSGSPTRTVTQIEQIREHATVVYVTSDEKARLDLLAVGQAGIPISIVLGLLAHFGLGVKLFSNLPTRAELRERATSPPGALLDGPVRVCPGCGLRNISERQICKRCGAALGAIDPEVHPHSRS